jgi:ribosome biogenesis GTPase
VSYSSFRGACRPSGLADRHLPPAGGEQTATPMSGVVIRAYGKWFDVQLDDESRVLMSTVKGTLRRERRRTDLVAVGDRVSVIDVGDGEGQIVAIAPRGRVLARRARLTDDVEQVILANLDQVLFLFSVREPEPHRRMLDRFLVMAESRELPALIGVNKVDLDRPDDTGHLSLARATFADYERIYPVHYLSAASGEGLSELQAAFAGKMTAVAGPSGVGKSSLLNRLDPDGVRAIGEVSAATGKGRHTTTATILHRLPGLPPTYVADTPGIRALALHGVSPDDLPALFPEFRPYLDECLFPDCTHLQEPGCAVRDAVVAGAASFARYESYAALRRGDTEDS